jgi:hypothetical protein
MAYLSSERRKKGPGRHEGYPGLFGVYGGDA